MTIQYAVPIVENETRKAQGKSEILHVGLLTTDGDGKPMIQEIPVRRSLYESLTAAKKLAYAKECAEVHHPSDRAKALARRAAWDADDKTREMAKFVMRHVATTADGVTVSVTWQGLTATHAIANDPANATANAKASHQALVDAKAAEAQAASAFNVG